jgi:hypothetical protein
MNYLFFFWLFIASLYYYLISKAKLSERMVFNVIQASLFKILTAEIGL